MSFYLVTDHSIVLKVRVYPKSSQKGIKGLYQDSHGNCRLKVYLHEPAQDNQANQALIKLLSKTFKITPSQITIHSGHQAHDKQLLLPLSEDLLSLLRGYEPPQRLF